MTLVRLCGLGLGSAAVVSGAELEKQSFEDALTASLKNHPRPRADDLASEPAMLASQQWENAVRDELKGAQDSLVKQTLTPNPKEQNLEDLEKALFPALDELVKKDKETPPTTPVYNGMQPFYELKNGKFKVVGQEALFRIVSSDPKARDAASVWIGKYQTDHERRYRWLEYQIRTAAEQVKQDVASGAGAIRTSINVYPEDFIMHKQSLLAMVKHYTKENGVPLDSVALEVTEYQTSSKEGSKMFDHTPQASLEHLVTSGDPQFPPPVLAALQNDAGYQGYGSDPATAPLDNAVDKGMPKNVGLFNPTEANQKKLLDAIQYLGRGGQGLYITFDDGVDQAAGIALDGAMPTESARYLSTFENLEKFLPFVQGIKFDINYLSGLFTKDGNPFISGPPLTTIHPAFMYTKQGQQPPTPTEENLKQWRGQFFAFIKKMAENGVPTATLEYSAVDDKVGDFPAMNLENTDRAALEETFGAGNFVANGGIEVELESGGTFNVRVLMQGGRTQVWARNPHWSAAASEAATEPKTKHRKRDGTFLGSQ